MERSTFVIGLILLGAFVSVNSLQCYVCSNCPNGSVKDEDLKTCGAEEVTTTVAPTTVSVTPTTVPIDPTTAPAESTTAPAESTTAPAESTTAPAESTTAPVQSTTAPAESTTAPAESTTAPVQSTTAPVQSTTAPVQSTTAPVQSTVASNDGIAPQASRVRRYVLPGIDDSKSGCRCNGEYCDCDENEEFLRDIQYADNDNITYVCATITGKVNGSDVVARGCAPSHIGNTEICEFVKQNSNITSDCKTCSTDKCNGNSAFALQQSVGAMLFVLTLAFFTK